MPDSRLRYRLFAERAFHWCSARRVGRFQRVRAALFDPPPFSPEKLRVEYLPGANDKQLGTRRYTLTHNDVTGTLQLAIGYEYNQRQLSGWYTRVVRDEVLAEWVSLSGAAPAMRLHVYCHVSGEESWPAPPNLRSFIFQREMTLVLDTIIYAEQALLQSQPHLARAPILLHLRSHLPQLNRVLEWGTLGDRTSWPKAPSTFLQALLAPLGQLPGSAPASSVVQQAQQLDILIENVVPFQDSIAASIQQQLRVDLEWMLGRIQPAAGSRNWEPVQQERPGVSSGVLPNGKVQQEQVAGVATRQLGDKGQLRQTVAQRAEQSSSQPAPPTQPPQDDLILRQVSRDSPTRSGNGIGGDDWPASTAASGISSLGFSNASEGANGDLPAQESKGLQRMDMARDGAGSRGRSVPTQPGELSGDGALHWEQQQQPQRLQQHQHQLLQQQRQRSKQGGSQGRRRREFVSEELREELQPAAATALQRNVVEVVLSDSPRKVRV